MRVISLLGALVFSGAAFAGPQINVGEMYDYLDADKGSYLKRIFNGGDSTAYVRVSILEIIYDEHGVAQEVPLQSQSDLSVRNGLMASPARMIVPVNGTQGTRLLFLGERTQERYFRLRFVPVLPEKEDEFAVPEEEREDYKKHLTAGVNVLAGYGTIFFVRPATTRFDTQINEDSTSYRIDNRGNSVVLIDEFNDCPIGKDEGCAPPTKRHVLPGKDFHFTKQSGREYRFKLIEGTSDRDLIIKG